MDAENESLEMTGNVQASAYNEVFITGDDGSPEYAAIALVKHLISRNVSLDAINDSNFLSLLKSVAQNPAVIQKSLWKFEEGVKQYMQMVIASWKTTGCTMIGYDLNAQKGSFSPLEQRKLVLGFYCPKGFIFVELPPKEVDRYFNYFDIRNALKDLVSDSLYNVLNDVIQVVQHAPCYRSECQYQAQNLSDTIDGTTGIDAIEFKCIRQQIQLYWRRICEISTWVQSLIKKSDILYDYIVASGLYAKFCRTLKQDLPRLFIIMQLELELRSWLSQVSEDSRFHLEIQTGVLAIIDNDEFWKDGNELLRALEPLFKIPHLMDTLIPTAGYFKAAIESVKSVLETYSERQPLKFKQIWEDFAKWSDDFSDLVQTAGGDYLSPAYISMQNNAQKNLNLGYGTAWKFITGYDSDYDDHDDDEREAFRAEIEAYNSKSSNPFVNISMSELEANHPITLWSKYGGQFPQLQKSAYRILSQPSSCLCKQVEKQVSKIEGADNFMLRLNALMMEEFAKMGDQIYQPMYV